MIGGLHCLVLLERLLTNLFLMPIPTPTPPITNKSVQTVSMSTLTTSTSTQTMSSMRTLIVSMRIWMIFTPRLHIVALPVNTLAQLTTTIPIPTNIPTHMTVIVVSMLAPLMMIILLFVIDEYPSPYDDQVTIATLVGDLRAVMCVSV